MNSIEVRCAVKSYDHKTFVLNGLNLTVRSGSIYGLIGASGCGKTTVLSSILGMQQLDGGNIKVLGEEVTSKKASKFSHVIGYMPQETGLVPELTVKETLYYFGNIFQMDTGLLKKRTMMILDLLELKNPDKRIEQMSGGEKRRVSLAAVIVHDPQILILDEPTAGLDSLLREKIWNFLIENTRMSYTSVIITTHYIAEAEKSDCCGLMRHGVLLAEESPQNIMTKFNVANLEEAFLSMSVAQSATSSNNNFEHIESIEKGTKNSLEQKIKSSKETVITENANIKLDKRKNFCKQTLKALLKKELIRIRRQPAEIFFMILFPLLETLCFTYALGRNPDGLKIGIVNNEIRDNYFCTEYLKSTNYTFNSSSCYFENLSCHFLQEIQESTAFKVYHNSFDDAFRDAKALKTRGFLSLSANFTDVIIEKNDDWEATRIVDGFSDLIEIYLDQTDSIITSFLQLGLFRAYERFNKKILRQCGLNEVLEDIPVNITEYHGSLENDYTMMMIPTVYAQVILLGGILFSASAISQSRIEGVWNRTLLAGVQTSEILTIFILVFIAADIFQVTMLNTVVLQLYEFEIIGNKWIVYLFCILISMVGSSFGLFISILTNNLLVINSAGLVVFFCCGMLCGGFWPIESQPLIMRIISYILPTTIPSMSIKNIIAKGYDFLHPTVSGGFGILICWLFFILFLCFFTLKKRKFTEDSR